jgi:hypothetical protein
MESRLEMNANTVPQFINGVFYKRGWERSGEQIFLKRVKAFPQNNSNVSILLILPILHTRSKNCPSKSIGQNSCPSLSTMS